MASLAPTEARRRAEAVARRLAEDERVRLVFLFGSAADGSAPRVRDLDLAFAADPPLTFQERLVLHGEAESLAGLPVHLVPLEQASVVLAQQVADHGVCLFARTPEDEVGFVTRARARYWDFRPFLEAQWRLAGDRLEERRRDTPS